MSRPAPAVDVLLPVRDGGDTLGQALDSLRAQTLADWRCLVLDDGSTDDTAALAADAARADARIVPVRLPARGLVPALNEGLARATAPLVARLDADDVARPERLALQAAMLAGHPDLQVVGSRVRFFGEAVSPELRAYEAWLNATLDHDAIVRDLFVESPLAHPSVVVRTAALRALGGWREGPFPEDYDLWLRAWRAGWRFAKCPEVLTELRDHGRRLTKTDARYTPRAFLECKVTHLVEACGLAGPGARDVVVWGAGRDGKRAAKALRRRGARLRHLVDVAPTKLGRSMLGLAVRSPASLAGGPTEGGGAPGVFVVAAVGVKGARAEIRAALDDLGWTEGRDFACFG